MNFAAALKDKQGKQYICEMLFALFYSVAPS
jgi:hypothetical protein